MKLKAVGAILGKVKQLILLDDGSRQWVGDGYAFYLLPESFGKLNERAACAIFDIQDEKAANWRIRRKDLPEVYDVSDDGDGREEFLSYDLNSRLLFNGFDRMPAAAPDGKVYFLQSRYMKPLTDADPILTLRYTTKGQAYFIAKAGMFAEAIIMPMALTSDLSEWMQNLVNGGAKAHFYSQREIGADDDDTDDL